MLYLKRFLSFIRLELNNLIIRLFFHRPKMNKKYYISLCTIFKNEAPYLAEWINYHLIVGYDHFYLYNNFSKDNYQKILAPYIEKELVTLIDWPVPAGQTQAYNDCVKRFSEESSWIAFQDADEFAVPVKYDNVKDWLKKFEKFPCVLGFYRNFSSNGVLNENYQYVIETFTSCSVFLSPSMFLNTHYSNLIKAFKLSHFARFKFFNKICPQYSAVFAHLTNKINDPDFQFNHYYCKSLEYFLKKKIPNGDAYKASLKRSMSDFYKTENTCIYKDYTIYKYLLQLKIFKLSDYVENAKIA